MEQITFLTYGDVVDSGACLDGVIDACKEHDVFFGRVDEMLKVFEGQETRILKAAELDGYGDGNGNGNGNGYGYGDGNGYGDGYGDGYGEL